MFIPSVDFRSRRELATAQALNGHAPSNRVMRRFRVYANDRYVSALAETARGMRPKSLATREPALIRIRSFIALTALVCRTFGLIAKHRRFAAPSQTELSCYLSPDPRGSVASEWSHP
jgi:hypothetical protein